MLGYLLVEVKDWSVGLFVGDRGRGRLGLGRVGV